MRDAFGGTFLMYLILTMVVIFVTFMAETLKYVQAYRVKNTIINYIEEYEGFNTLVLDKLENESNGYFTHSSYRGAEPTGNYINSIPTSSDKTSAQSRYCSQEYGYCVQMEYCEGNLAYYRVTTTISLDFFVPGIFEANVPPINVPGETRYVTLSGVDCTS